MQTATSHTAAGSLPVAAASTHNKRRPVKVLTWYVREAFALATWTYTISKLFVFDIDIEVASLFFPSLLPVVSYRFFIFLFTFAVLWFSLGSSAFAKLALYLVFYPGVLAFRFMPRLVKKHWPVLLAFSPAICSRILGLRRSCAYFAGAAMSAFVITTASNPNVVIPAMLFLGGYFVRHYYSRFRAAFRPATVFADVASLIRRSSRVIKEAADSPNQAKNSPPKPEEAQKRDAMLTVYTYISCLEFLSIKFREVAASRKFELYLIFSLLYSMIFTIVVFAFEYYAIETLFPGSFFPSDQLSFWSFLSYSSSALTPAHIGEMRAVSTLAQVVSHVEFYAAAFLTLILFYVVLTINKERYNDDLDRVINELSATADGMRADTEMRFRMKLDDLELHLMAFNATMINTLRTLRGLEALTARTTEKVNPSSAVTVCSSTNGNSGVSKETRPQDGGSGKLLASDDAAWLD
jgi:hypothetical protein